MNLERLSRIMSALSDATGLPVIWKSGANMLVETALPLRHRFHTHPFCLTVKETLENRCLRNDDADISRIVVRNRQHFIHACHAGAEELVIPIFYGDSYCGTIMIGPFAGPESATPYPGCEKLLRQLPELKPAQRQALVELVEMLIVPMAGELADGHAENLLPPNELIRHETVRHAIRIMRERFRARLTLSMLSRECAVSTSHFQHLFRVHTELNALDYLQRLRVLEARRLIALTDLPLGEIAGVCGFSDQSRMALLFRRYFGRAPGSYRKRASH